MTEFILPCAVGALTGVLAACGVGGGTLLLLYMTAAASMSYGDAKIINLLFFIVCAGISMVFHLKNKLINLKASAAAALCGSVTAAISAYLARDLSGGVLKTVFGVLFIIAGVREIFMKQTQ